MANTVIALKKSSTPSAAPVSLANGEIAINYADGVLYYRAANGAIASISSGSASFGTVNAAGTLIIADTINDVLDIRSGDNIEISGDAINDRLTITANLALSYDRANAAWELANTANNKSGGGASVSIGNTAPVSPTAGDLWWDDVEGRLFIYYTDVDSSQWVESNPSGGTINVLSLAANVAPYFSFVSNTANAAYTQANGAFDKANNALANSTGTFAGDLTITGNTIHNKQLFVTYTPSTTINAAVEISSANTKGGTGYADVLKLTNIGGGITNPSKWIRITSAGALEVVNSSYQMTSATLSDSGNFTAAGTITPGAWSAGQVIKDTMLGNSEVTVVSTTIATSGSTTNFVTYNYTPVSASSYLLIHYHLSKYAPQGTTDDSWFSQLLVDGNEIAYGWQMVNDNGTGTSGRSGVLFPLTGRYTNSSTSAKQIQVAARRDTADDSITIDNTGTSMWLRITEIAR